MGEEEEDYEEAADQTKSNQSRSVLETASKEFFTMPNSPASSLDKEEDPEIPPRRGDKSEEASRSSWQEDAHSTKRNSTFIKIIQERQLYSAIKLQGQTF